MIDTGKNKGTPDRYIPIKTKVILFASVLGISLAVLVVVYLQYFVRASFEEETISNLHVMEEKNMGVYSAFIGGLKARTVNWSSDNYIKELAEQIVDPALSVSRRKAAVDDFGTYMRNKKMRYDSTVLIADILDQNGIVVASSREERIGTDELKEETEHQVHYFSKAITAGFGEAFARSVVFEDDETSDPMFHISTRMFRTDLDEQGNLISLPAVLLVHFVSLPQLAGFLTHGSNGVSAPDEKGISVKKFETLETYIVNKDRFIVTPTRSITDMAKKERIATKPVEECFVSGREIAEEYLDYRGVSVIGASTCLAEDGLVLINEIESREAYKTIDTLVQRTLVAGGMIFLAVTLMIFLATRRLLRNLEAVTFAARWFALGIFDERAPVASGDEIGQLAATFNSMLDKIETSKSELTENLKNTEEQNDFLKKTKVATMNVLEDAIEIKNKFESQRNELQTIISSIGEGLILVDKDYVITLANPMAGKILGLSLENLVGKKAHETIQIIKGGKDLSMEDRPISRVFTTKQNVEIKLEDNHSFRTASGKEFPVAMSATPLLKDGDVLGSVVAFRNITQEKSLDEAKSSFISIASHQLRTPLTSIRWYSEMLMSEDTGPLTNTQRDFVKEVNDGALRLYQTIDLLLAISRIESGRQKSDTSEIELNQFTQDVVKELDSQLKQKNLSVTMNYDPATLPKVTLDPILFRQVVLNLISNSIRYTNNDGHITIEIVPGEKEVQYTVKDDGIGVPEAEKSKIFSKFFRAENARTKVPDGSGLGLALVKDIVEAWGGTISFESEEGKGAMFRFTVPLGGG